MGIRFINLCMCRHSYVPLYAVTSGAYLKGKCRNNYFAVNIPLVKCQVFLNCYTEMVPE